jgi:hypothetical protein
MGTPFVNAAIGHEAIVMKKLKKADRLSAGLSIAHYGGDPGLSPIGEWPLQEIAGLSLQGVRSEFTLLEGL